MLTIRSNQPWYLSIFNTWQCRQFLAYTFPPPPPPLSVELSPLEKSWMQLSKTNENGKTKIYFYNILLLILDCTLASDAVRGLQPLFPRPPPHLGCKFFFLDFLRCLGIQKQIQRQWQRQTTAAPAMQIIFLGVLKMFWNSKACVIFHPQFL